MINIPGVINRLGSFYLFASIIAAIFYFAGVNNEIQWLSATLMWIGKTIFILSSIVFWVIGIKRFGFYYFLLVVGLFLFGSYALMSDNTILGFSGGCIGVVSYILLFAIMFSRAPYMKERP